jgi:type IV pilus assembly protein PilB
MNAFNHPARDEAQSSELSFDRTLVESTEVFEEEETYFIDIDAPPTNLTLLRESAESASITQLVDRLLGKALERHTPELHFEPQEATLVVRYRQGNSFIPLCDPLPRKVASALTSRFKLIAGLNIGQRQIPQKGRVKRIYQGRTVYFMISTLPSFYGEKVVVRILDDAQPLASLEQLIGHAPTLKRVRALVDRPSGLILVAGSNRNETAPLLYALLLSQTQQHRSLVTVEDPILRILDKVTQIGVDEEKGMDYETAMQALFSQASDVILIDQLTGEKTAKLAINLALQGRLVIASLPAQNPASAIAHLRRWVDPQQLADALVGAMGQQPLRKLCPACRLADSPSIETLSSLRLTPTQVQGVSFYRANTLSEEAIAQLNLKGRVCRQCNGSGYLGHIHTFDVIGMTLRIRDTIAQGVDVATLLNIAQQEKMTSRLVYGLDLAMRGETTLDELKRGLADDLQYDFATTSQIIPARIQEKLQTLETYLLALSEEFKQLNAEFQPVEWPSTPDLSPPESATISSPGLEEVLAQPTIDGVELEKAIDPNPTILVGDATICEELLDPGEWDVLKKELDQIKETVAGEFTLPVELPKPNADREIDPFASISDPWS